MVSLVFIFTFSVSFSFCYFDFIFWHTKALKFSQPAWDKAKRTFVLFMVARKKNMHAYLLFYDKWFVWTFWRYQIFGKKNRLGGHLSAFTFHNYPATLKSV